MPEEIDDFEELIKKIQAYKPRIVTIDGLDGIGKTTLAHEISRRLGQNEVTVISLDLFLRPFFGRALFKIGILRNLLREQMKSNQDNKTIIVEGVLLREVMEKLRRATNNRVDDKEVYHIYCKSRSTAGVYDDFYEAERCEDLIINGYKASTLRCQLLKYHKKFEPCSKADVIYIRVGSDNGYIEDLIPET